MNVNLQASEENEKVKRKKSIKTVEIQGHPSL